MTESSTILFAGGGTGGHLFPGIAVAEELRRRDATIRMVFAGSDRAIETTIARQYGLEHKVLPVESLSTLRKNPWRFATRNWQAWRAATSLIRELRPSAVIGLGGFASAPLVWCARRRRIPIVLLEQNVIPGQTTRWLSRWADCVCVSFEATLPQLPMARSAVVTGNPVRQEIARLCGSSPITNHPERQAKELLILGGSQGADSMNAGVVMAIEQIRDRMSGWQIVHQSGPREIDPIRQSYARLDLHAVVEPFFHDLAERLATASLVISRAGATTLAELACAGCPMILVPYPHAAHDHQRANAVTFVEHRAALMVDHAETVDETASRIGVALQSLLRDGQLRKEMGVAAKQMARPDAASSIANSIIQRITDADGCSGQQSPVKSSDHDGCRG